MSDIADRKYLIQQEETKFQAAVSESVMSRVGAVNNFIVNRENSQHDFNLNGAYNIFAPPFYFGDGYITYPWPFEIVDVLLFTGETIGTSGTTEVDLKWKPEIGGTYQSIFSTTPKFDTTAAINDFTRQGKVSTGFIAPVLSKSQFDAFDVLKLDVLQTISGPVNGLFVKVFVRPRDPT